MHGTFKTIETKSDPFSLDTLIGWLEKQPADKVYCYVDNGRCLLAQYFEAMGFENVRMRSCFFTHGLRKAEVNLPPGFNAIAANHEGNYLSIHLGGDQFTFGRALDRARMFRGQR